MAMIACDICNGKLTMGTGGIAVCNICGMEHDKDRIQEKTQAIQGIEGTFVQNESFSDGNDTAFSVILKGFADDKKIAVIKAVREVTGLGLKEAKDLAEAAPKPLRECVSKEKATEIKELLFAAGGIVDIIRKY